MEQGEEPRRGERADFGNRGMKESATHICLLLSSPESVALIPFKVRNFKAILVLIEASAMRNDEMTPCEAMPSKSSANYIKHKQHHFNEANRRSIAVLSLTHLLPRQHSVPHFLQPVRAPFGPDSGARPTD
ncbi:hypothetical protein CDAR_62561 [Caerostris darwini]|uniref:Uncharacterized protein n=1 Tax=Caerostris darwini TaxID=1538125 RepID=A0AAV4UF47_9ARAC|nr:hypothetical protein CDAR_62561 [Caerostris darwini]